MTQRGMAVNGMRIVSGVLVALLFGWMALSWTQPLRYQGTPRTHSIELASMSESALRLPKAEVDAALKTARDAMFARNLTGARFAQGASLAMGLNLLCSIVIAIALGWAGRPVTPGEVTKKEHLVGLPRRWARVIGLAAGLAGAAAFGGNEARQYAEQRYAAARDLNQLITDTQRALGNEDEIGQREALDILLIEAQKP